MQQASKPNRMRTKLSPLQRERLFQDHTEARARPDPNLTSIGEPITKPKFWQAPA